MAFTTSSNLTYNGHEGENSRNKRFVNLTNTFVYSNPSIGTDATSLDSDVLTSWGVTVEDSNRYVDWNSISAT